MEIKQAKYLMSSPTVKGCPAPDKPEFAFVGRSNVGKSSLINFLTGRKSLALTSVSPGKTKNINHFIINDAWYLVDLPGYGFAKVSKTTRDDWQKNLSEYLMQRTNLLNVFALIDVNIPPQQIDLEFINWMGENKIPFSIVFTKADKPNIQQLNNNVQKFLDTLSQTWQVLPPHFVTSSTRKAGKEDILDYIDSCFEQISE